MKMKWLAGLALSLATAFSSASERALLDIVDIHGDRTNQLVGYGLVVGLSGTGDGSQVDFTSQSMANMLNQFGVRLPDNVDPKLKNVAAVTVTANISTTASTGQTLDVTVSSIGDADSLQGGTLLVTPLTGIDGEIYAVAQGNLVVGGISASGNDGSSIQVNTPTVGTIPNGATVEREIPRSTNNDPTIRLTLKTPHYKTARNVEKAINEMFGPEVASAQDAGRILVKAPKDPSQRVTFLSILNDLTVKTGRERPRVVYNSRTGTIVMGQDVRVRKAAVSHGNLTVTINESFDISQPNPAVGGNAETRIAPRSDISVSEDNANMFVWPEGTNIETIVKAINSLGAAPSDVMSILQALDQAGALEGDIVII